MSSRLFQQVIKKVKTNKYSYSKRVLIKFIIYFIKKIFELFVTLETSKIINHVVCSEEYI